MLRAQMDVLQSADVLVLNEVDWGMKRSDYRAVVKDLADALKMNWAYGVEFVEVDPKILGTQSFANVKNPDERKELEELFSVDKVAPSGLAWHRDSFPLPASGCEARALSSFWLTTGTTARRNMGNWRPESEKAQAWSLEKKSSARYAAGAAPT